MVFECPSCDYRMSWVERWEFSNLIGIRQEAPCPKCRTHLIWAKVPFRMVHITSIITFSLMLGMYIWPGIEFYMDHFSIFLFVLIILAGLTLISTLDMKFEIVESKDELA